ncbi:MAG: hypothetical protein PHO62_07560 [Sulfurimonas sp.]|uniref:hypothetical protein n=1 Tax=Sulfurimonas sp. TaxID=2022749 RepID=UPI00263866E8|nr:hypothetical protein [Sulfurimonas sp.]MDD5373262.1 hypothetical protein [Sulfurimonas sp.]
MQINTKYSIGDVVKIRYLVEEAVPYISAHIIEDIGIIDSINITRFGIQYRVYIKDETFAMYTEIVELIEHQPPEKLTKEHLFQVDYHGTGGATIVNKITREKFDWFAFSNDGIALGNKDSVDDINVTNQELEDKYEFEVNFQNEPDRKLSLKNSEAWEVEDSFKVKQIVITNSIKRYCALYDCTKIKKVEIL